MDIITKAREELALAEKRAEELRAFLRIAESLEGKDRNVSVRSSHVSLQAKAATVHRARPGSLTQNVLARVIPLLWDGRRMHTRDILKEIEEFVEIPGDTEDQRINRLSGIIYKSKRFNSSRTEGWALNRPEVSTDPGIGGSGVEPPTPHP